MRSSGEAGRPLAGHDNIVLNDLDRLCVPITEVRTGAGNYFVPGGGRWLPGSPQTWLRHRRRLLTGAVLQTSRPVYIALPTYNKDILPSLNAYAIIRL